jgi:hypothetical protein
MAIRGVQGSPAASASQAASSAQPQTATPAGEAAVAPRRQQGPAQLQRSRSDGALPPDNTFRRTAVLPGAARTESPGIASAASAASAATAGHVSAASSSGDIAVQIAPASPDQQALAQQQQQWHANVTAARQAVFGEAFLEAAGTLTAVQKTASAFSRGAEPAAFDAVSQGLSSGATFGMRGGVSKTLQDSGYTRVAAGAMAGLPMAGMNFLVEKLIAEPIGVAQKASGRPVLVPVKPEVLFPDPCPTRSVTDASGQTRLEAKTPQEMLLERDAVRLAREDVTRWQNRVAGKGLGSQPIPLGIGVGSTARRAADAEASGAITGLENSLSSALGAGLPKAAMTLAKAGLFREVDNLQGGRQSLPMFVVKQEAASGAEEGAAGQNPVATFLGHAGRNAAQTAAAMARSPLETLTEALVTNMLPNVLASAAGEALGEAVAGDKPTAASTLIAQGVQSYATSTIYRQGKNGVQLPEQHSFQGDVQTRQQLRDLEHDTARTSDSVLGQHPSAEGLRRRQPNPGPAQE